MSICPKNKSSKGRRDKRRANWKMSAMNLVKCSKCGELMMPHRVCKSLRFLQQERDRFNGGLNKQRRKAGLTQDVQASFFRLRLNPFGKFCGCSARQGRTILGKFHIDF